MGKYTRGEFLGVGGWLAAGVGSGAFGLKGSGFLDATRAAAARGPAPDLILVNGKVQTVDDALPKAEAFAVKNGRFIAVGSTSDIRNLAGAGTEVIDAGGMFVTPGFMDCHCHPSGMGDLFGANCDVSTIAEVLAVLKKRAATTKPGYWVAGFKYDDTNIVDEKTGKYRRITRQDLDSAVPDLPVRVSHRGGHIAWFNSKAFELAGISKNTPDPFGGRFEHDANGELTGLAQERATALLDKAGKSDPFTRAQYQQGVEFISKEMAKSGLTSVHQTGTQPDSFLALQDAYRAGNLSFRMYAFPRGEVSPKALYDAGIYTGFGDEHVRVGAIKYACDGSCSGRSMAMNTPYVGKPNDYGVLTMSQEDLHAAVEESHRHNFQVGVHANGDKAIEMVLNAFERVQKLWPRADARHRIEHCTLVNPEILGRMKAGGIIPAPFWTYCHYHGSKWGEYGEEKLKWFFAHRSFLDYGIPVCGASDYTPGPYEPLMAIQSMATRKDREGRVWGANQRVSIDEGIRIGTINGAHASFEEKIKGSITAGKLADFVVFEKDLHTVDPDQIKHVKVVRTVLGGLTTHKA